MSLAAEEGSWWRSPSLWVRALVMAFAAFAATAEVATAAGTAAAMLGASGGTVTGHRLGRSRLRLLPMVLFGGVALLGASWLAAWIADGTWIPAALGPRQALLLSGVAKLGVACFSISAVLRAAASRHAELGVLELLVAGAALGLWLAPHRDGVVARPLWLSDWAGQRGLDPRLALMSVGALAIVAMAVAAVLETGRRVSAAALAPLVILLAAMFMFIDAEQLPEAQAANDLGLTDPNIGDPPRPSDIEGQDQPGPGGGRGEGENPRDGRGGGGSSGDPLEEALRGGGGGGEGGQQGGGSGQAEGQDGASGTSQGQGQGQGQGQSQRAPDINDQQTPGQSPAPMAVVILGDDYTPPTEAFYFRQQVWSEFNGARLVETRRADVDRDVIRSFPTREIQAAEPPPDAYHQRVRQTIALVVRHVGPFAIESGVQMRPAPNPKPGRFWRAYTAESLAPSWTPEDLVGHQAGEDDWSPERWAHYLSLPEDPRYGELARSLVERLPESKRGDPFLQALAVKLWMDEQLVYSTSERHAGAVDPTADFLFGNRIGYCVHFAHAAVYMWRALGIPARVGAGYHVSADEAQGSTILIRGGDAHAWPELYLEGVGWVVLDISARQNLDPPGVPVDDDLAEKMAQWARDVPEPGDEAEPDSADAPSERRDFRRELTWLLAGLAGALFLGAWGTKLWRRTCPAWAPGAELSRVAYRRALDRLSEAGLRRQHGESRERFARRIREQVPAFAEMTALHVAGHFGDPRHRGAASASRASWRELDGRLRAQLRAQGPRWRRWLGTLNPFSFLGVR